MGLIKQQFFTFTYKDVHRQPISITIRYDSVYLYLTCSKKLTGSQLSLPHEINKKLKCKTNKNDQRDRSGPVPLSLSQSSK